MEAIANAIIAFHDIIFQGWVVFECPRISCVNLKAIWTSRVMRSAGMREGMLVMSPCQAYKVKAGSLISL